MRTGTALIALALALAPAGAAVAAAQADPAGDGAGAPARGGFARSYADPGAVIAAEVAFNQLAHRKGQWTAFRQTAADGAIMFVPARVVARDWLRGRADPPAAIAWQPHGVWLSCDGSYAVTHGAWQGAGGGADGAGGVFVTVWQRQKDGTYKWVLNRREARASPPVAPEMIAGKVADCPRGGTPGSGLAGAPSGGPGGAAGEPGALRRRGKAPRVLPPPDPAAGRSDDATLRWTMAADARGAGTLVVETRAGDGYREVLREAFAGGA